MGKMSKKWLIGLLAVVVLLISGCSDKVDVNLLKKDGAQGFPPSEDLLKEAKALPKEYKSEKNFSFRYPQNWGALETYEEGDVSLDRLNEKGERTDGALFISVYTNEPSGAPQMDEILFGVDTEKQLKEDKWTDIEIKQVKKYKWQDGVWFITEYEGKYDGKKEYCEEYYWEDSKGNVRIFDISFYQKESLEKARPEFLKMIYSAQMKTGAAK